MDSSPRAGRMRAPPEAGGLPSARQRTVPHRLYTRLGPIYDALDAWAERRVPAVGAYPARAVRRRLLQRVAAHTYWPALTGFAKSEPEDLAGEMKRWAGLGLDGSVTITPALFFRTLAAFAAHWASALSFFAHSGGDARACALVFGVGPAAFIEGNDSRFTEYCRKGPVEPLSAPRLLVEQAADAESVSDASVAYRRRLLPSLKASFPRPGPRETLRFLSDHFAALAGFALETLRLPCLVLLGRDFAYHAMAAHLDRAGALKDVVLTNSDYDNQALWMTDLPGRRFKLHFVWYSTNIVPLVYNDEPVFAMPPQYRYLTADVSWTWSEEHSQELRRLGLGQPCRVAGPIVWSLPAGRSSPRAQAKRVGIFDVTPVDPEWAKKNGSPFNYYAPSVCCAMLRDAVEVCREAGMTPILKAKRDYAPYHDRGYVELVRELSRSGGLVVAGPEGSDLLSFISGLDLVIVAPFSSPAHVARHLGVPSIYYDPTGLLSPAGSLLVKSPLVFDRDGLLAAVRML